MTHALLTMSESRRGSNIRRLAVNYSITRSRKARSLTRRPAHCGRVRFAQFDSQVPSSFLRSRVLRTRSNLTSLRNSLQSDEEATKHAFTPADSDLAAVIMALLSYHNFHLLHPPSNAPRTVPEHHQLAMTTPICKLLSITFLMMNNCLTSSAGHGGLAWSTDRTPTPSGLGSAASSGSDAEAGKFFFILIIFDLANV